jgi:hypothetical protein
LKTEVFIKLLKDPKGVQEMGVDELRELALAYPYSQVIQLLYGMRLRYSSEHLFNQQLGRAAALSNDRSVLFELFENKPKSNKQHSLNVQEEIRESASLSTTSVEDAPVESIQAIPVVPKPVQEIVTKERSPAPEIQTKIDPVKAAVPITPPIVPPTPRKSIELIDAKPEGLDSLSPKDRVKAILERNRLLRKQFEEQKRDPSAEEKLFSAPNQAAPVVAEEKVEVPSPPEAEINIDEVLSKVSKEESILESIEPIAKEEQIEKQEVLPTEIEKELEPDVDSVEKQEELLSEIEKETELDVDLEPESDEGIEIEPQDELTIIDSPIVKSDFTTEEPELANEPNYEDHPIDISDLIRRRYRTRFESIEDDDSEEFTEAPVDVVKEEIQEEEQLPPVESVIEVSIKEEEEKPEEPTIATEAAKEGDVPELDAEEESDLKMSSRVRGIRARLERLKQEGALSEEEMQNLLEEHHKLEELMSLLPTENDHVFEVEISESEEEDTSSDWKELPQELDSSDTDSEQNAEVDPTSAISSAIEALEDKTHDEASVPLVEEVENFESSKTKNESSESEKIDKLADTTEENAIATVEEKPEVGFAINRDIKGDPIESEQSEVENESSESGKVETLSDSSEEGSTALLEEKPEVGFVLDRDINVVPIESEQDKVENESSESENLEGVSELLKDEAVLAAEEKTEDFVREDNALANDVPESTEKTDSFKKESSAKIEEKVEDEAEQVDHSETSLTESQSGKDKTESPSSEVSNVAAKVEPEEEYFEPELEDEIKRIEALAIRLRYERSSGVAEVSAKKISTEKVEKESPKPVVVPLSEKKDVIDKEEGTIALSTEDKVKEDTTELRTEEETEQIGAVEVSVSENTSVDDLVPREGTSNERTFPEDEDALIVKESDLEAEKELGSQSELVEEVEEQTDNSLTQEAETDIERDAQSLVGELEADLAINEEAEETSQLDSSPQISAKLESDAEASRSGSLIEKESDSEPVIETSEEKEALESLGNNSIQEQETDIDGDAQSLVEELEADLALNVQAAKTSDLDMSGELRENTDSEELILDSQNEDEDALGSITGDSEQVGQTESIDVEQQPEVVEEEAEQTEEEAPSFSSLLKQLNKQVSETSSTAAKETEPKPILKSEIAEKIGLMDAFVEKLPDLKKRKLKKAEIIAEPEVEKTEDPAEGITLVTETLARVYIKQGHFKKAIQAYEILRLKYPEKSSFFASRISDIKKLSNSKK